MPGTLPSMSRNVSWFWSSMTLAVMIWMVCGISRSGSVYLGEAGFSGLYSFWVCACTFTAGSSTAAPGLALAAAPATGTAGAAFSVGAASVDASCAEETEGITKRVASAAATGVIRNFIELLLP